MRTAVVTGVNFGPLEHFAAAELTRYMRSVFGISVKASPVMPDKADLVILIGNPAANSHFERFDASDFFDGIGEQGIVIKSAVRNGRHILAIGGGSPKAVLWAVYDIARSWGVGFLFAGDIFPDKKAFTIQEYDIRMEPVFDERISIRVIGDMVICSEYWGFDDYRPVIDYMAKLKFNTLIAFMSTYQPYFDFEYGGIKRQKAWLSYGFRYPVDGDTAGKELFREERGEFWNPDLPVSEDFGELRAPAIEHLRRILAYAHDRGLVNRIGVSVLEYPPEFAPLLKSWRKIEQLGQVTIVPGPEMDLDDDILYRLAAETLNSAARTYPEADVISIAGAEFGQWTEWHETAWNRLDAKYGLSAVRSLEQVLEAAGKMTSFAGGLKRAVSNLKEDIVRMYFLDRLLTETGYIDANLFQTKKLLNQCRNENLAAVAEKIKSINGIDLWLDYTPTRALTRRQVIRDIKGAGLRSSVWCTITDDNIGMLPQIMADSIRELMKDMYWAGIDGYYIRYHVISNLEPCFEYISKASWDRETDSGETYREFFSAICGEAAGASMTAAMHELEKVTKELEWHGIGLTFTVPGMLERQWKSRPSLEKVLAIRDGYEAAAEACRQALSESMAAGKEYIRYWIGRIEFAILYMDILAEVKRSAAAEESGEGAESVRAHLESAFGHAVRAIETYAGVANNRCDLGAIAALNEYVYRYLKGRLSLLQP